MSTNSGTSADIHFSALCNSIEHEKLEKARAILETHPSLHLDIANNDGFTPLDLAFMTGNHDMLKLLLSHRCDDETDTTEDVGRANEGQKFPTPEAASSHLVTLIKQSKDQVEKFGQLIKSATIAGGGHLTPAHLKECEKQKSLWQKRLNGLKKLKIGLDNCGRPHAPSIVRVEVTGPRKITVKLSQPEIVSPQSLFTKFRVQWSKFDSFNVVHGEAVILCSSDRGQKLECYINGLEEAERYFVRAAFGNPKGFGSFSAAIPKSVIPSSWRSVQGKSPRIKTQLIVVNSLVRQLEDPQHNLSEHHLDHEVTNIVDSGLPYKLLQLFTLGAGIPKLQRSVQPNKVYLCSLLFHEDRVLMTNEEVLPLMLVDDYNSRVNIKAEQHWLSKLTYNWPEVTRIRNNYNKHSSAETSNFKQKLLNAVHGLQSYLTGLHGELGQLYYQPFYFHNHSSVVLCLVRNVRNFKSVVTLSLKWVPMSKAQRSDPDHRELASLRASIRQQIFFHQVSQIGLNRGLYLCYVQARSSLDEGMQVIVSNTSPSILPYLKIRENPHVTSDEWRWIIQLGLRQVQQNPPKPVVGRAAYAPSPTTNFLAGEGEEGSELINANQLRPTEEQYAFGKLLQKGLEKLFDYLEVKQRLDHRIYDAEVIELSDDVNVILVLPPAQRLVQMSENDSLNCLNVSNRNDLMPIGLNTFEVLHLGTYHPELLAQYVKLSTMLEIDLMNGRNAQREAFTVQETDEAMARLSLLANQQQILEESWKPVRWLYDILSRLRNRGGSCGITYAYIKDWYSKQTDFPDDTAVFASEDPPPQQQEPPQPQSRNPVVVNLSRTPTTRSDPSEFSNEELNSIKYESRRQVSTYHVNASSPSDHGYSTRDEPNILQIYAAYDTGLASGTSVKLNVTRDTTAREVIDLVIKQLNMAVILKGRDGPVYENDKLKNFCLVAVIGSRERCLRDDFKPLNLQNPWKSGKLFVRMKNDVLAALERINSSSKLRVDASVAMSSSVPNVSTASRHTTTVL